MNNEPMTHEQYLKFQLEICNQEYNGDVKEWSERLIGAYE